jgi:CotH kinase protein
MNTRKISAQPGPKSIQWFLLLACSAGSACTGTPEVADTQPTNGAGSEGGDLDGPQGSGSLSETDSGSGSEPASESGADPDPNAESDTTGEPPDEPSDEGGPISDDPNDQIPPLDAEGCHGLYAQDLFPTFELTVGSEVWEQLVWEWDNGQAQEDAEENPNPYHPLEEFRYGEIVITDAEIRLRGNPTFWSPEDKLQFQIGFDQNHDSGHFLGLRRLAFDAATFNKHMLRDRLALSIMRDMGIIAPCANNARLEINGEYYGVYTSIEKLDEVFIERAFDDPTGDLWDRHNWELKSNEDTTNNQRLLALTEAETIEELETYLDLEQALRVFAADALIPNSDGPWAGGYNFFLYDDPLRNKFVLLPWDLDNTFERFNGPPDGDYPPNPDPVVWEKANSHGRPLYELALEEPEWFDYYVESLEMQFESSYGVDDLHSKIDAWTAQIQDAVFEDPNKWYSDQEYLAEVDKLRNYVEARNEFMTEWLSCWQNGGSADEDGYCELP